MTSLPINEIVCGRNETVMATFPAGCIDLTVTSPPYDLLRSYKGFVWDFDATARELWRVTKQGGVVVWVVADATVDGSESGTSFRQALAFMALGFRLHDTMIYQKNSYPFPDDDRYYQVFEYMFVFSKGSPKTHNLLRIKSKMREGSGSAAKTTTRAGDGGTQAIKYDYGHEMRVRDNVWPYDTGYMRTTLDKYAYESPAMFPEKLAEDHILSWSNPGNVVLDPFVGSGTTAKMAIKHHRQFIGIDISPEYCDLARRRIGAVQPTMFDVGAF